MKPSFFTRLAGRIMATAAVSATVLLAACDKATDSPFDFSSITIRDVNGQVIANDATDWRNNETWSTREQKLFPKYKLYSHTEGENFLITALAYPNPTHEVLTLNFQGISEETRVELRFVDPAFNVLEKMTFEGPGSQSVNIQSIAGGNKFVRVYYMFINGNNCLGHGHGDIELE